MSFTSRTPRGFRTTPTPSRSATNYDYAAKILEHLATEFGFKRRWSFCARYLPGNPTAGLPLTRIRELYREADAILNVCGTQEFNEDLLTSDRILYIESDPGRRADQGRSTGKIDHQISAPPPCPFHLRRECRQRCFPGSDPQFEVASHAPADRDRSLENQSPSPSRRRLHVRRELVHERAERHRVARRKISLEQVARVSPVRRRAEEIRRTVRAGDRHQGRAHARQSSSATAGVSAPRTI